MIKSQTGFTLLEVLLAVSITALIGVGASQLLSTTASTQSATESRAELLKEIQRMNFWVNRDLSQVSGRDVLNIYGDSILSITTESDFIVEFTRSGLAALPVFDEDNEDQISRSNMQRVAYAVRSHESDYCKDVQKPVFEDEESYDKQCFVRLYWPVLDQASDSEPIAQLLLEEVEEVRFYFRGQLVDFNDPNNTVTIEQWQEEWPGPYITPNLNPDLVQIKMVLSTRQLGEMERIFEVPRYAFTSE